MPSGNLSRNEAASSLRYRFDRSDTLQRSAETQVLYRSAQSQTDFKFGSVEEGRSASFFGEQEGVSGLVEFA